MYFLVSRNYGSFSVTHNSTDEHVTIMISQTTCENVKFGGVVRITEKQLNTGMLTYFKTNPAYRETELDGWEYTSDEATILLFVVNKKAYIVVDNDGKPILTQRDYSDFDDFDAVTNDNVIAFPTKMEINSEK
jgi:hypothetical protein